MFLPDNEVVKVHKLPSALLTQWLPRRFSAFHSFLFSRGQMRLWFCRLCHSIASPGDGIQWCFIVLLSQRMDINNQICIRLDLVSACHRHYEEPTLPREKMWMRKKRHCENEEHDRIVGRFDGGGNVDVIDYCGGCNQTWKGKLHEMHKNELMPFFEFVIIHILIMVQSYLKKFLWKKKKYRTIEIKADPQDIDEAKFRSKETRK